MAFLKYCADVRCRRQVGRWDRHIRQRRYGAKLACEHMSEVENVLRKQVFCA